ncbi:WD40 repeat domain-containing protein [Bacillus sp. DTU_2020_1000418_1_SI_GHA_SEK_038]|uniref:WD40 repeat domain-containing protein n=1 Tax=Bacillus sp. DTU_2020_1000418_1_SI_GHA_SEK_038 TaxID=3077585 RepID=UPI0028E8E063|nr:WD40 repeat domain-containing protein [Bacillus sp. DTU_2020_1000418_1_SI_GHA_SEK_038]WNS75220.1 WD40 repeat domain-containing protein [Bacillus sp. DTU_2020_1000418_1_SI_GHA_SEK_038]
MRRKFLTLLVILPLFLSFGQTKGFAENEGDYENEFESKDEEITENEKSKATLLGPQVFQTSALTSAAGTNDQGIPYMYFVMHGTPSALAVVDLNSNELVNTYTLSNSTSAWGLDVDEDGTVWVGGTTDGNVYSYNPNTWEFRDHGNKLTLPKDTAIQDIDAVDGVIFGSTAYGGSLFKYDSHMDELVNFGQVLYRKEFAKSIAYDQEKDTLYIGVGSKADLVKFDLKTKKKTAFLPEEYKDDKYVRDIRLIGNELYARMDPSNRLVVFDKETLEKVDEMELNSRTVSLVSPNEDAIYYSKHNSLYKYDLINKEHIGLGVPLLMGTEMLTLDFVELNDENYPGFTLVGLIDNAGNILKYNLETGYYEITKLELPPQPVTLYTMIHDEKRENIFINGYMSGGLAIYNTNTNQSVLHQNISQIESMTIMGDKLYIGAYPKSRVLELDLTKPWSALNPREIMRLGEYGQERSTAITALPKLNKVFVGTYPETSLGGGALAVYDLKEDKYEVYENYIYNQSLVSFLHHKEFIYGGTSIHANYQVNERGARFFRFRPDFPEEKEYIHLPLHASMITSLIADKEGTIWGMADGTLVSYNPDTKEIRTKQILELISGRFRNAKIIEGIDGNIYGTVEGKLFKADRKTMEVETLMEEGAYELAQDSKGDLYFRNQADLWKYEINQ